MSAIGIGVATLTRSPAAGLVAAFSSGFAWVFAIERRERRWRTDQSGLRWTIFMSLMMTGMFGSIAFLILLPAAMIWSSSHVR